MTEPTHGSMRCLRAALTAVLLCLHGAAVHASAAAPENVRIKCKDHRPTVSWDSPQPGTFTVELSGSDSRSFSVQTAERELDLSEFLWSSTEQIFDYHIVTVTAEQGLNRSSRSPSFSYNKYKTVNERCSLRFPPLNLAKEGPQAMLTFENPLFFYKELDVLRNRHKLKFTTVTQKGHEEDGGCKQERVCKFSVDLPEDAKPCVTLSGVISNNYQDISVTHEGDVCVEERPLPPELLWTVSIVSVIFIAVILVLVFLICKNQVWSFDKTQTPQTLAQMPQTHRPPSTHRPDTVYSRVQILRPISQNSQDPHSPSPDSTEDQAEDQALIHASDQVLIHEPDQAEYRDGSIDSTQTETCSIHSSEDEIQESNYESRGVLIEMDVSGDVVKGYTR